MNYKMEESRTHSKIFLTILNELTERRSKRQRKNSGRYPSKSSMCLLTSEALDARLKSEMKKMIDTKSPLSGKDKAMILTAIGEDA